MESYQKTSSGLKRKSSSDETAPKKLRSMAPKPSKHTFFYPRPLSPPPLPSAFIFSSGMLMEARTDLPNFRP